MSNSITNKPKNNDEHLRMNLRMGLTRLFICAGLLALVGRLAYINIVHGEIYAQHSVIMVLNRSDNTERVLRPIRGFIFDRNNQHLAVSETVYDIILDVRVLNTLDNDEREKILNVTAGLLDMELNTLRQVADDPRNANSNYVKVAFGVTIEKWTEILSYIEEDFFYEVFIGELTQEEAEEAFAQREIRPFRLRSVHGEMDIRREYPRNLAPQVIGFIRPNNERFGLENSFNTLLSGRPGRRFRTYSMEGFPITDETPAVAGYSLVTTLDASIQEYAQTASDKALAEFMAEYATIIVMNPHTAEILAMAQSPGFDPNYPNNISAFTNNEALDRRSMSVDEQNEFLFKNWMNFNISNPFEPGSIFKPIVVAAALEEGIISLDDTYYCNGYRSIGGHRVACWIAAEGRTHGNQTLTEAMANSCNVAMMDIVEKMGREMFYHYRNDFGYGERTGIDLPNEHAVSDPWLMFSLDQLNPVELATSSFGQGFTATAIQSITSFAPLINGGYLMRPYIVSQILDRNGNVLKENSPTLIRRVISSETSDQMRIMLHSVVTPEGTGRRAMIDGHNIGGKTGTGQQIANQTYEDGVLTLTFFAYFPVENPRYLALAVIDNPLESTEGSISAAPMLREVLENIIEYRNIRPSEEYEEESTNNSSLSMPDFTEVPLNEATQTLNRLGLDFVLRNDGDTVIRQFPAAGEMVTPGSEVILFIRSSEEAELAIVPDVTGLTPEEAFTLIYASNLSATSVTRFNGHEISPEDDDESTGQTVHRQMPEPGQRVQIGTEVRLIISS